MRAELQQPKQSLKYVSVNILNTAITDRRFSISTDVAGSNEDAVCLTKQVLARLGVCSLDKRNSGSVKLNLAVSVSHISDCGNLAAPRKVMRSAAGFTDGDGAILFVEVCCLCVCQDDIVCRASILNREASIIM